VPRAVPSDQVSARKESRRKPLLSKCFALIAGLSLLLISSCGGRSGTHSTPREVPFNRHGLVGVLFRPAHPLPGPAVLVLGGSEGGVVTPVARALAQRGYPSVALAYFDAPDRPSKLCRIPIEYFGRAIRWLRGRYPGARIVVLGASRGSEAALLSSVHYPQGIAGVIGVAPSSAVQAGLCAPQGGGAAWTFHGRPIPHLPAVVGARPPLIAHRFLLPVWRLQAALLAIGAGDDAVWPSGAYARQLFRLASPRARAAPGRLLVFPRAGHGIGCFLPSKPKCNGQTSYNGEAMGGTVAANKKAQRETWAAILGFLRALRRG
jgi:dienelactone hydrolase